MNIVQEFEGMWEEVRAHEQEFAGRKVRVQLLELPQEPGKRQPNLALQRALEEGRRLHAGMEPSPAEDTVALIREARSGGMFGEGE